LLKKRVCVYISEAAWKQFIEVCKREGEAASNKLDKWIQRYVQIHRPGNPQLLLNTFLKPTAPSPVKVACKYIRGALSDGRVYCTRGGGGMWIKGLKCYSCPENWLRKKSILY